MYGLDLVNDVDASEELLSSVWKIWVTQGTDPTPTKHLEGTSLCFVPAGSNRKTGTMQRIGGLWPDVTYAVQAIVITTTGNTRNLWSHIRGIDID